MLHLAATLRHGFNVNHAGIAIHGEKQGRDASFDRLWIVSSPHHPGIAISAGRLRCIWVFAAGERDR
jgi:hypothetical protein